MCNHYVVDGFVILIISINMQRLTPLNAEILKFCYHAILELFLILDNF